MFALVALGAQGQQPPVFRGTTDIVRVFVTVTDRDGKLVTSLGQEDFELRDEGRPQPITLFDNTPQPIRLVVMLDVSGSMEGNLQLLRSKAYARSLERLLPLIDHQQVNGARAGNAEQVAAYQQTSQYVIERINQLRGEQESTEHTTNVGLRIFDDAEPAVKRIEPAATSEDELDVPEFLKDGFQPANA